MVPMNAVPHPARPKFYVGQEVWYMKGNKPCLDTIMSMKLVQNLHKSCSVNKEPEWQKFGKDGVTYGFKTAELPECYIYGCKEDLIKALFAE